MTTVANFVGATWAANAKLSAAAIGLTLLTLATPSLHLKGSGWALIATFAIAGFAAYMAPRLAADTDQRAALLIILGGAFAMRLSLLPVEPYLSSDIYRYIWDGRVQAAGINPYRYAPMALELSHLRDAGIFPNINRASYAVTIYPPVAQGFYLAVTRLGESVLVIKLALVACEAATVGAILALLARQGTPLTHVAAYAWHPLPIWEIAGNGHVDAAMIALLMASVLLFVGGRTLLAGAVATLGALVKPLALLALPVFWKPWNWRLPLVVGLTAGLAYLPYLSVGLGVLGFLPGYLDEEGLTAGAGSGFKLLWLLERLTGLIPRGATIYIALATVGLACLALAAGFRTDRSQAGSVRWLGWLLIAFLALASPHYPWYFLVLVPFLALVPSVTTWVMTLGSVLFYDVLSHDVLPGYEVRIIVFTAAMLGALALDLWWVRPAGRAAHHPISAGETS